MADEPLTIRAINWREVFPFVNLFRAFRVAIHPSKIVLALVALVLLYVGGRVLDGLWPVRDRGVPNEVTEYEYFGNHAHPGEKFSDRRDRIRGAIEANYAEELLAYKIVPDRAAADRAAKDGEYLGKLKDAIVKKRDDVRAAADSAHRAELAQAAKLSGDERTSREKAADQAYDDAVRSAYDGAFLEYQQAKQIKNIGLFDQFFDYEASQVSLVARGVRDWNWFGKDSFTPDNPVAAVNYTEGLGLPGVIQSVLRFFTVGPLWLLSQHPIYFILCGSMFLVLWAIFGGAISRIAAVHIARDEKVSIRSALKFSLSKFLSFLFAPIIPLLIILVVGLIVTIGALLGNIPQIGPILLGALFFLDLAAGFVMALVLLGLVGGFNLMYPTIAVEGSDSFDAISRSFSYLYARPWRLAFYTVVSIVYGSLTYLFVRLFIFLMLALTHKFVGLGMFTHADSTAPLWPTMWPSPATAGRLGYEIDFLSLDFGSSVGAFLVAMWVYLAISVLGAFTMSFYFSSNAIIYYLMRREVDATELDDVYLEQIDDEFAEPSPAIAVTDPPAPATGESAPPASEPSPA